MKKTISIIIFLFLFTVSLAETLVGTVSYVSDGDTLHLQTTTGKYKIRFYGIDAPESTQDYGLEAKSFVVDRVLRKEVKVEVTDTDRYGRKIGKIYYGNDRYLNEEVVKSGYGWWYRQYAKGDTLLRGAEEAAKVNKRGLWQSRSPMKPWDYRRARKSSSNKSINTPKNPDAIVYVTKSGKKYHRDGCRYLKSKYRSYTVKEAEAKNYSVCSKY